jgi:hypothetical protein
LPFWPSFILKKCHCGGGEHLADKENHQPDSPFFDKLGYRQINVWLFKRFDTAEFLYVFGLFLFGDIEHVIDGDDADEVTVRIDDRKRHHASSRDIAEYLGTRGGFAGPSFTAEGFVLYSARDSVGGGPYVVEEAYPLAPAGRRAMAAGR